MQDNRHGNLEELVRAVVDSYSGQPSFLPNKAAVIEVLDMILKLLFPGYFEDQNIEITDPYFYVGSLMMSLCSKLQKQICRALLHDTSVTGNCTEDAEVASARISYEFLTKIPKIRALLLTDVDATLDGDPAARNKHEIIFAYPGIYAISVYRIAHESPSAGRAAHPRDHDGTRPQHYGRRYSPWRRDRHHFCRPRHRHCHRRDDKDRQQR